MCTTARGMGKWNVLYMYMGLLLGLKKDAMIGIHLEGIKWDKPVTKRQTLYDSTSMR